jgi:hypothetical protein
MISIGIEVNCPYLNGLGEDKLATAVVNFDFVGCSSDEVAELIIYVLMLGVVMLNPLHLANAFAHLYW